jgi:hypothetical protein
VKSLFRYSLSLDSVISKRSMFYGYLTRLVEQQQFCEHTAG